MSRTAVIIVTIIAIILVINYFRCTDNFTDVNPRPVDNSRPDNIIRPVDNSRPIDNSRPVNNSRPDLVDIRSNFKVIVENILDNNKKPKTVNSTNLYNSKILNSNTINSNNINSNNIVNYDNMITNKIISYENIAKNMMATNIQVDDIKCNKLINKNAEIANITTNNLLVSNLTIRADNGKFYKLYIEDDQLKIKSKS